MQELCNGVYRGCLIGSQKIQYILFITSFAYLELVWSRKNQINEVSVYLNMLKKSDIILGSLTNCCFHN